jgi:hypothetical protein
MKRATNTFAFVSSSTEDARAAAKRLASIYGQTEIAEADVVVALGGDGFLLQTLRETMSTGKKVYGMNRGTVGFLMNEYREDSLRDRLQHPLGGGFPESGQSADSPSGTGCRLAPIARQGSLAVSHGVLSRIDARSRMLRRTLRGSRR